MRALFVLLFLSTVAGCGGSDSGTESGTPVSIDSTSQATVSRITYTTIRNGETYDGLPVRFENFDAPELEILREREHLDEVVAGAATPFEVALRLKDWTAAQFPHDFPNPYPPWNALVVLDWIRSGKTGGFCGQYSQVLLQALAAMGLTARYVEVGGTWHPAAHFVVEVWSNQYNKWVVLDADYNIHFERNGIPLSALQVHDALVGGLLDDVQVIKGTNLEGHYDAYEWPLKTAEVYYYLRVHLKANHLSAPDEPPFDRYNDMVEFLDDRTTPWEDTADGYTYPTYRLTNLQTGDRQKLRGRLNQTFIEISSMEPASVTLKLDNSLLAFKHYQWRTFNDLGVPSEWTESDSPFVDWQPNPRQVLVQIRGVNTRGVAGPSSAIRATLPGMAKRN
jgi:hypothetical protein